MTAGLGKETMIILPLGTGRSMKRNWGEAWQSLLPVCIIRGWNLAFGLSRRWSMKTAIFTGHIRTGQFRFRGKSRCARETSYCLIFPEKKCATVYLIRFVPCWIREKLIMSSGIWTAVWQMSMPEICPMITCLVSMILWSVCAAGTRIFCWRDVAVAAVDLTRECFIIPHRSGVVTIPMQSTAQGSSTELRFSIRFPKWGRTFRRCRTTRPDGWQVSTPAGWQRWQEPSVTN